MHAVVVILSQETTSYLVVRRDSTRLEPRHSRRRRTHPTHPHRSCTTSHNDDDDAMEKFFPPSAPSSLSAVISSRLISLRAWLISCRCVSCVSAYQQRGWAPRRLVGTAPCPGGGDGDGDAPRKPANDERHGALANAIGCPGAPFMRCRDAVAMPLVVVAPPPRLIDCTASAARCLFLVSHLRPEQTGGQAATHSPNPACPPACSFVVLFWARH
ncbi:hypothetical protein BKA80DRAFT_120911 [Phyllosticta citrichinensis]